MDSSTPSSEKSTSAIAETRAPVWLALSELFLDTELDEADYDRIARILAASPYSEDELEEILRFEVTPVLRPNLRSMAGEWSGFDPTWLRQRLTARIGRRPFFRGPVSRLVRAPWLALKKKTALLRAERAAHGAAGAPLPHTVYRARPDG